MSVLNCLLVCLLVVTVYSKDCYWNSKNPYSYFSTKTPYDAVRGDIRDETPLEACEAISVWTLHRHGNRSPGSVAYVMKELIDTVHSQILEAYEAGRSQLCAQDVEAFRNWIFNETMLTPHSFLMGTGYEEMYGIGKRLRHRYPHLFQGSSEDYYIRPTISQRTVASAMSYLRGFTEGTNLSVNIDGPFEKDDLIRPHVCCLRYQKEVRYGHLQEKQTTDYANTEEFLTVQRAVQARLGITYQLTPNDIYTLYEICRYHRTWVPSHQDAWCAAFTNEDLVILEYRDDVQHYYRNGYGSWISPRLAGPILKDLRERFRAAIRGEGKKVVTYISHNSITEMAFAALGLFRDNFTIIGSRRVISRVWRTTFIASFSTNMMVVLNRCTESGAQTHRVQFFINEQPTTLCPLSGCSWHQFEAMVKDFDDNLDFCSLDYPAPAFELHGAADRAFVVRASSKDCYWNSKNPYSYFSTKTPYDAVRGDIRDEIPLEGCTPTSLWAFVRHGTRHPTPYDSDGLKEAITLKDAIIDNFYAGRGEMCAQDINNLANWTWDDSIDSTWAHLTKEGYQELLHLGQRVRERFSPLLGQLDTFQFRPSDTQRTKESAKAFVEGLEDTKFTIEAPIPDRQDAITRPYKVCDKFKKETRNRTRINNALEMFRATKDYQEMLTNVRRRVALPDLTPAQLTGLYDLCRYHRAYSIDKRNAWCSVFRNEDLQVLEFAEDLVDHYYCGYASSYGAKLGAMPLKNLYENLEASVNGSHRITGYFSHDTMVEMILTALGLYHDYPAINSFEINRERKWRTSLLAPFATNIMVVLNKCSADDADSYRVQVFMNEMELHLCEDRTCEWAEFKEKLLPFADSNLDFCKV